MQTRMGNIIALCITLAACGGGSAAPMAGTVAIGVIAGNHQTVGAGYNTPLPQKVDVQVYQTTAGQVGMRVLSPSERVLRPVLPEMAYAQTVVQGIPNQVVCATTPDPKHVLRAEVGCANSDALGHATFVFHTDTVAGTARADIAAALSTGTMITDSVSATVLPGPIVASGVVPTTHDINVHVGDSLDLTPILPFVSDTFGNHITSFLLQWKRMNSTDSLYDATWQTGKVPIRTGDVAVTTLVDGRFPIFNVRFHFP